MAKLVVDSCNAKLKPVFNIRDELIFLQLYFLIIGYLLQVEVVFAPVVIINFDEKD